MGGVDDFSNLSGEVKEGRKRVAMRRPTPTDSGVIGVVLGAEGFQGNPPGFLSGRAANKF
ncbi:MAG: hypothetical protein RLZZ245_955 [Verrucomicrobiota bacterium]|jgi:hypothetical protein